MESFLIIILGIAVISFIIVLRNDLQTKFNVLNQNVITIHKQIKKLQTETTPIVGTKEKKVESKLEESPLKDNALEVSFQRPVSVTPEIVKPIEPIVEKKEEPKIVKEEPKVVAPKLAAAISSAAVAQKVSTEKISTAFHVRDSLKKEKSATEQDYEKLIGENWLNKIGIAILVIGIGFFVKYAIDKNWIGEWGRLSIGIGTAFLMIAIAHRLRKKYHAFSSVLIGGGIATLYYSISIGYHDYELFSQPVAFGIMTVITLFSTIMSIWYDRKELAIISLIGGFTAPFMVAGETNNAAVFFTYIAILNSGMLALSFFKKWLILHRLAFTFTSLYLAFWIADSGIISDRNQHIAFTFLLIFFVQFLAMNIVCNVYQKAKFNALEFVHLFSVSGLFYGGMMYVLECMGHDNFHGLFTSLLAVLFVALSIALKRMQNADKNLVSLLIGKAVTFVTLAIFVQFNGHYITLFWAVEAVVLLWLSQQTKIDLLKQAAVLITVIATLTLFRDWAVAYGHDGTILPIVYNEIFITGVAVLLTYCASIFLLKREEDDSKIVGIPSTFYRSVLIGWVFVALYLVMLFELIHQAEKINYFAGQIQALWIYHFVFIFTALMIAWQRKNALAKQVFFILGNIALILYAVSGHPFNVEIRDDLFSNSALNIFYNFHFLLVVLFVAIIFGLRKISLTMFEEKPQVEKFLILLSLYGIYILTAELDMLSVHAFSTDVAGKYSVLKHTQVAGYTVLWGIYSFVLMVYGMRKKLRFVRIFSLVVFSITLVKLFAFDIRDISEGGKIVAFISLGVMLLVISFMYQKVKQIIVDGAVN